MSTYLDTNYIVRFLTNDIPNQAQTAKKVIEDQLDLYINSIVLAETIYILENHYQSPKKQLCSTLINLLNLDNINHPSYLIPALSIYQQHNSVSFYDCLLLAETKITNSALITFDQKLTSLSNSLKNTGAQVEPK